MHNYMVHHKHATGLPAQSKAAAAVETRVTSSKQEKGRNNACLRDTSYDPVSPLSLAHTLQMLMQPACLCASMQASSISTAHGLLLLRLLRAGCCTLYMSRSGSCQPWLVSSAAVQTQAQPEQ